VLSDSISQDSHADTRNSLARAFYNLRTFDGPALVDAFSGHSLSFLELSQQILGCASAIKKTPRNSGRIGVLCSDPIDYAVSLCASLLAGVGVPLNPNATIDEIKMSTSFFGLSSLLISGLDSFKLKVETPTISVDGLRSEVCRDAEPWLDLLEDNSTNQGLLLRTSGTTGSPKKVGLSPENILSGAHNVARSLQLSEQDSCLNMWNRHLIGGVVDTLLAPLISGSTVVFGGPFDAKIMRELLSSWKPTWTQFVPTTLNEFVRYLNRTSTPDSFDSLSFIRVVGAELDAESWRNATRRIKAPIIHTWGMTEAGPLIASTRPLYEPPSPGNVGTVIDGVEVRQREIGTTGRGESEFLIRGPSVIKRYLDDILEPADTLLDGWFPTGDLGYVNSSGEIVLTGRLKELIRRGAMTVYPRLIEECANKHPGVLESACVGVPHKTLGEDVVCVIVPSGGERELDRKVGEFLALNLPRDQVPSRLVVMDSLPRNAMGKILRDAIRSQLARISEDSSRRKRKHGAVAQHLLSLWKEELDSRSISITTNFFAAGGDSLSAVRVAAEVQALYGVALPPDWATKMPTIASLERFLLQQNPDAHPRTLPSNPLEILKNQTVLARENSYPPRNFLDTILHSQSEIEFLQSIQVALRHLVRSELLAIQAEIRSFAESRRYQFPDELFPSTEGLASNEEEWSRTSVGDFISRYQRGERPKSQCIVAFTGFGSNLMIPIHMFLDEISGLGCDVVLVFDPHRSRYRSGVPGLGSSMEDVVESVGKVVGALGYCPKISLGVSGGTEVASRFAVAIRDVQRLSIAGPASAGLGELPNFDRRLSARVLSPLKGRDLWGAVVTRFRFPLSKHRVEFRTRRHNVLYENYRRGTLGEALSWLLH